MWWTADIKGYCLLPPKRTAFSGPPKMSEPACSVCELPQPPARHTFVASCGHVYCGECDASTVTAP